MARIFVGNLPMDCREKDVEDIFYKYGKIRDVDLKTPLRPPAFAFVAFEDMRDAKDAVRGRDGYDYEGNRLRVEIARSWRERAGFHGGGPPPRGPRPTIRTSEYRVIVTGLPLSASWQDLKDHMRKAGDVLYSDVDRRGGGIVHYASRSDMEYALRKMDDSEFRNAFDRSYVRVSLPRSSSRRDSRSPKRNSRSPRRSSYSPRRRKRYSSSRSRSSSGGRGKRSYSRSRSPKSSASKQRSRSRSRSRDDYKDERRYSKSPSQNGSVKKSEERNDQKPDLSPEEK